MESFDYVLELFRKGGPVMWPLLLCSVISLAVSMERVICLLRATAGRDDNLLEQLFTLVSGGCHEKAVEKGHGSGDPAVAVVVEGLKHRDHGLADVMQVEAERQLDRLRHGLGVLDTVITMAPLLGILGTVTGIIKSFNLLNDAGLQDPRLATGGISEALITTAAGLVVALATLLPYNFLLSRIAKLSRRIEHKATQFEVAYRSSLSNTAGERKDEAA